MSIVVLKLSNTASSSVHEQPDQQLHESRSI